MRLRCSKDGAVLVVVLGILALLSVIAISFVFSARMSMRASEAYMLTVAATDVAEAGIANAIAVLEADKIYRTGDPLNPYDANRRVETYDSLRDSWRQVFSAPVIIEYNPVVEDGLVVGDIVTNVIEDPPCDPADPDSPDRCGVTGKVIAIDRANNRLYLNSVSAALWRVDDRIIEESAEFEVTVASVSKPDDVDLDDDGSADAIWHNYYDESGKLLGRYAVLVQDESSKVNVNVAGNIARVGVGGSVYDTENPGYDHGSNEGWSTFEINLATGLETSPVNAKNIVLYRHGLPGALKSGTIAPTEAANRIYVAGQGDLELVTGTPPLDFDDDDDNYNRYFYENDGVDNDGDGRIDEEHEGINEPEEFRVMRPVRLRPEETAGGNPLEYDGIDNDADGFVDETNEADDQPIFTLEQLEDDVGVAINEFLSDEIDTYFGVGGETTGRRARRHLLTTLSLDQNLNENGELRVNLNVMNPIKAATTVYSVFPPLDAAGITRELLRNIQKAVNMYDYRDRNHFRTEIKDRIGNVFAGVDSIRINEVMVRAATAIYEAEWFATEVIDEWEVAAGGGSGSPRGSEEYLTNPGTLNQLTDEESLDYPEDDDPDTEDGILLPNPPFTVDGGPDGDGNYPFRLRMRVRSRGTVTNKQDKGFFVYINRFIDPPTAQPIKVINSTYKIYNPDRWATADISDWYIEEGIAILKSPDHDDLTVTDGLNMIQFVKAAAIYPPPPDQQIDTVDVDWLYFTQEPDCEWMELVNIGNETVDVNNWMVVSEYIRDKDETAGVDYFRESFQLKLPNVGIFPIDKEVAGKPDPPHYIVFVIDEDLDISADVNATEDTTSPADERISFATTWSDLAASANIYQFTAISNIYSTWIDFFGNEPFDDDNDTFAVDVYDTPAATADDKYLNVDVGTISLYDDGGNLVDRVTYNFNDARPGFRSLQRNHPANPGDRLNPVNNFKLWQYIGDDIDPEDNLDVLADGAYDDWRFPWGAVGWSTPAAPNHRSDDSHWLTKIIRETTVANPEGRVKDGFYSNVGEIASVPFYNEYLAIVAYNDGGGLPEEDRVLSVGDVIVNGSKEVEGAVAGIEQRAIIAWIDTTDETGFAGAPTGWMLLRGDGDNPVNAWQIGDDLFNTASPPTFSARIVLIRAVDTIQADEFDFLYEVDYIEKTAGVPLPAVGEPITNISKDPEETATVQFVEENDATSGVMYLRTRLYDPDALPQWVREDPATRWKAGETLEYPVTNFVHRVIIEDIRGKTADARGLADYFTTSFIELEAQAATLQNGTASTENWPDEERDPAVYVVPDTADFALEWDGDDGLEDGTFDLYNFVNYGDDVSTEYPVYVGPVTVKDKTLSVDIENLDAAAEQYRFMRAMLTPALRTFGRINVNTASHRVLQGLPGIEGESGNDLARAIIRARNMQALYSVGDIYRVSEFNSDFDVDVFKGLSNLITTRSDMYKIIVQGEAAIDSNNNGIVEDDEVTARKKLEVTYRR